MAHPSVGSLDSGPQFVPHISKTLSMVIHREEPTLFEDPSSISWFLEPQADRCGNFLAVHRNNPLRMCWSVVVYILLVYTGTVFLYRFTYFTFHVTPEGIQPIGENDEVWKVIDSAADILFWVDLVANFFLTYRDSKGKEVDSLRLIARNYLMGFFWINLLACFPDAMIGNIIQAFMGDDPASSSREKPDLEFRLARVSRLQRVSRLARLSRLTRLVKLVSSQTSSDLVAWLTSLKSIRLVNFSIALVWTVHLLACGWYLCAALHTDVEETWLAKRSINSKGTPLLDAVPSEQWLVSMYFVLTVFTTVGFGDISANTEAEILYVACTMIIGAVVNGCIISQVINTVTSSDRMQEAVSAQVRIIDAFCAHTELSRDTSRKMKEEVTWRTRLWATGSDFNPNEAKELITGKQLPRWLISRIPETLFGGKLVTNKFIRCCDTITHVPPRLPCIVAVYLQKAEFQSGELIFHMHDLPFNLFLVASGTFSFIARPTATGGVDEMYVDMFRDDDEEPVVGAPTLTGDSTRGPEGNTNPYSLFGTSMKSIKSVKSKSLANWVSTSQAVTGSRSTRGADTSEVVSLYPYRLFSFDSYFGDSEIIFGCPRQSTARCERSGAAMILRKDDLTTLIEDFPMFSAAWRLAARRRMCMRSDALAKLSLPGRTYQQLAAVTIQRYVRGLGNARQRTRTPIMLEPAARAHLMQAATDRQELAARGGISVGGLGTAADIQGLRHSLDSLRSDFDALRQELRQHFGEGSRAARGSHDPVAL